VDLLTSAESGLRLKTDELAEGYLRSPANVGLVVGLLVHDECLCLGYGKVEKDSARPPDAGTVFEIGSITKVFTAALLAEMAGRGEVRLDQPVAELLPAGVRVPTYRGRAITLAHLAEHTAALPRLPGNLWATVTDQKNPYRDYQVAHLYEYLGGAAIGFPPGTGAAYSNLGAGLLGHVLALRDGRPFEDLLAERVLRPLALTDTAITLSADQVARSAPGHTVKGEPTSNWDIPTLAGAGALKSTAAEMLTFLRANLDPPPTPVGAALRACHTTRPVAWWRRVGVGALHGFGLATVSLLILRAASVPPGSLKFLAVFYLPVLAALAWKGFWAAVWAAAAVWVGSLLLGSSSLAWGPACVSVLIFLSATGRAAGYTPPRGRVRLGWQESAVGSGGKALWHNGGTGGYRSFIGFVAETQVGVAVLSNSANEVDSIGMGLLRCLHEASGTPGGAATGSIETETAYRSSPEGEK
jgi:CubicO group peptidase (beta-lactamase class C family)